MVTEFKVTVVNFCTLKSVVDLCMRVDLPLDKIVENQDWATGPSWAEAAGPLGRRGPRAAGLLLAKPCLIVHLAAA